MFFVHTLPTLTRVCIVGEKRNDDKYLIVRNFCLRILISRQLVLDVLEETLFEMDSFKRIQQFVSLQGAILKIGKMEWDLSKKRNVYLICGGKAANATCRALETVLGDRLTRGIVIVKSLEPEDRFSKCEVFVGGHPLPNIEGYRGCLRILEMVREATADDLFISAISGGTSALMSCPLEEFSLEEEILTTDVMLKSGAVYLKLILFADTYRASTADILPKRLKSVGPR